MKKIRNNIWIPIWICLILGSLLLLAGCKGNPLSTPSNVRVNEQTLELTWDTVKNASYYSISIEGGGAKIQKDSSKNTYSLESLSEGNYKIRVKAVVKANDTERKDSAWSQSISFTREPECGLTFKLINGDTAFEVSGMGYAEGNITVPDIYRGLPVTRIGNRAFYNQSTVTGVVLGENITEIGAQAFTNCSYLAHVNLPGHLVFIGDQAFQSCRMLEDALIIPDSVTEIGNYAFAYCRSLPSVTFGNGLQKLGSNAFTACDLVESIALPDSLKTIGEGAFARCSALQSLTFGNGVVTIEKDAFRQCTSLTNVTLGGHLETVGETAFAECTALTALTVQESVRQIGANAFSTCTALNSVNIIGSGLERIERNAFSNTALWGTEPVYIGNWFLGSPDGDMRTHSLRDDTVGIADYAFSNCNKLPDLLILPDTVQYIGEGAFANCEMLLSVAIGSRVETLGDRAFYRCTGLRNVFLGAYDANSETQLGESRLKSIGVSAFNGCSLLSSITIPSTVTVIGTSAFQNTGMWNSAFQVVYADRWLVGCKTTAIGSITVREDTVGISNYAFYNCTQVTGVSIPDSVQTIGRSAFYECRSLVSVRLPSGLKVLEDYTFYHCDRLILPEFPATLTYIGRSAFYKCTLVAEADNTDFDRLTIPDSVTYIGDFAFYSCGYNYEDPNDTSEDPEQPKRRIIGGIDILEIGNNVTYLGSNAFANMTSLREVTLGNGITAIGERTFYRCTRLENVNFGNRLESVGARAFYACTALKAAELPQTLTSVGNYAFYKCTSLGFLNLGKASSIGDYAFFGCETLTALFLPETVETIGSQAFRNCTALSSVALRNSIREIGAHAFYGCSELTVYAEPGTAPEGWNSRWNSTYRPVIWGCVLSGEDGSVVSFERVAGNITNKMSNNSISSPMRRGYTFAGWATTPGGAVEYTNYDLVNLPNGTVLYAVWKVAEQE